MLVKVFQIDVTKCQYCKGDTAFLAAITNCSEVARHLKHLGIVHETPATAPPRYYEGPFEFGSRRMYMKACTPLMTDTYGQSGVLFKV